MILLGKSAILFLDSCNILHRDIRCENVMITDNLEAKLTNFRFSRMKDDNLSRHPVPINWMAPEVIEKNSYRYTSKSEIFSFGMLIWELCYEKIPYENMSDEKISNHILNGKREETPISKSYNDNDEKIQKGLIELIKGSLQQDPPSRMNLTRMFSLLRELAPTYPSYSQPLILKDPLELSNQGPIIIPPEKVEKGIQLHREGDYKNAWKCFKENVQVGDSEAKYWKGYYLWEGYYVQKDRKEAVKLFKEAAEEGVSDAQLRYAFALMSDKEKQNIDDELLNYIRLSAENDNVIAQFIYGDIYLNGKFGIQKDQKNQKKGLYYLKLAANKNYSKAIRLLCWKNEYQ
ncbi:kinase-like domain-containing protein [Gigaspora rosea]|uniref:Kinase-like domain-containing protein n=1 Tax=Gigaspora rosea TaxID=44941 RepID=A0A397UY82_9GLOM|nr:kinase-like domain-containing protein [Gigaspora rosea]